MEMFYSFHLQWLAPSEYENYFYPLGTVEDLEKTYLDVTEAAYNDTVYGLPVSINILGIVSQ